MYIQIRYSIMILIHCDHFTSYLHYVDCRPNYRKLSLPQLTSPRCAWWFSFHLLAPGLIEVWLHQALTVAARGWIHEMGANHSPYDGINLLWTIWSANTRKYLGPLMTSQASKYSCTGQRCLSQKTPQAIKAIGDTPEHCLGGCDKSLLQW